MKTRNIVSYGLYMLSATFLVLFVLNMSGNMAGFRTLRDDEKKKYEATSGMGMIVFVLSALISLFLAVNIRR
jgi:hypothetical protein